MNSRVLYHWALTLVAIASLGLASHRVADAQTIWFDDFNTDTSDDYNILEFTFGRDGAEFAFDYSQVGIPEAPNSLTGGTTGVKFFVNDPFEDTEPRTGAVQIAPPDFGDVLADIDNYTLSYDLWMNVNGPLPAGGGGSTEAMLVGVGFNGDIPIEAGISDGTYFTLTGEANVLTDVRSFTDDGFNGQNADGTPVNVAQDETPESLGLDANDYYHIAFPGGVDVAQLPVQGGVDNQRGVTRPGQMAFMWNEVRVDVRGPEVSFYVNDLLIAQDQDADVDGTFMVGMADYFSSETDVPEWNFSVIDNLRVFVASSGDFDGSGALDAPDMDLLTRAVQDEDHDPAFDLTGDGLVNGSDRDQWINEIFGSYYGDSNLDGEFSSSDFVFVFQAGEYEDTLAGNSTWGTGDWNGDGDFDSSDFVTAFQAGGFELGPRAAAAASVPEPTGIVTLCLAAISLTLTRHRNRAACAAVLRQSANR